MNSIDPVRDNAKDIDDDRRYPNAKVSDINQSGKLPGPAEDNENAPLLIGDNLNGPVSEEKPKQSIVRRTWSWGFKNRLIIGLIGLLVAGVVVLGVYLLFIYPQKPAHKNTGICLTPPCVLAASELISDMSPRYKDIDPCTDFDKFVCEGWDEQHDMRADQDSFSVGTVMHERSQQILRHILESPYTEDHLLVKSSTSARKRIFNKAQNAYEACMDENRIKELGSEPLLKILGVVATLFPAEQPDRLSDTLRRLESLQKNLIYEGANELSITIAYLERIGVNSLVVFEIGADDKDPDTTVLSISAPRRPGLPSKEYYQDEGIVRSYSETIGKVLVALLDEANPGSDYYTHLSALRNKNLVKAIVDLETKLAHVTPDAEDADDVTKYYNPMGLAEGNTLIPELSIFYVMQDMLRHGYMPNRIIVTSPSYLKAVTDVITDATAETLQAYFVWKTVQAFAYKVEADALKPLLRFNNELQGKDPDASEERWRTCVRAVDSGLGWILSRLYVDKAFSEDAKAFGDRIVSDIKKQFIKKLNAAEWMSEDVRKFSIEKVHNIVQKIGYPTKSPDILDDSSLDKYYKSINISSTQFFRNTLEMIEFESYREWQALQKPTNRDEWEMTAPTVNAYYNPAGNEIVFPAGIMQAPVFYNPSIPQYLSYGAFGSVSGHELSHAFDSTGRHYDQTGNFTDWWDNSTVSAFEHKAQCFINQYHEFTVPGLNGEPLHVNGRLTLGENIADAGGLSAAFQAWKQREAKHPSKLLPGLQTFSKEQVFFISYANWWCGKSRKERAVDLVYRDPHSPTWARILGTMANSREFKEAFQCEKREPTCQLW